MQNLLECTNSLIEDQIEDIVGSYKSYQKIKGCIPTNNQRWSSQTINLKIRVIQWIKIEDQPQQILRVWFKVRCVHFSEWIHQDL